MKIEVKSSGYVQSWNPINKLSKINFNIKSRISDIYIFCLHNCKDKNIANPLDLNQWEFYIIKTEALNKIFENQKTITLSSVKSIVPEKVKYDEIKETINNIKYGV